jgi:hypothetical protein
MPVVTTISCLVEEFTMAANIKTEAIDELLASCSPPADLFDNNGVVQAT